VGGLQEIEGILGNSFLDQKPAAAGIVIPVSIMLPSNDFPDQIVEEIAILAKKMAKKEHCPMDT
jgi:hypothetical protein